MSQVSVAIHTGDFEKWFPHHNWILVLSLQLVICSFWSAVAPSIYQFITPPRSLPDELAQVYNDMYYIHSCTISPETHWLIIIGVVVD